MKKRLFLLFIIFVKFLGLFAQDSLAIEKDCEKLKTYLQEASIDISMANDEGLINLDEIIQKIKDDYNSVQKKDKKDVKNHHGIYSVIFAKSIKKVLEKELPYKNLHMSISAKKYYERFFLQNFVFCSDIYFEKKGNEYFVVDSNVSSIKKGMKYTGDEQNLLKTIYKNNELYRFSVFSQYLEKKAKINIENKVKKVPVEWYRSIVTNEEISYKSTNKSFIISITTCSPKDLNNFRKKISEIRKILETTDKTVIIDLRNNRGGYLENIIDILYSILISPSQEYYQLFTNFYNSNVSKNTKLNTQTIRDRVLVNGETAKFPWLKTSPDKYVKFGDMINENQNMKKIYKYNKNLYILTNYSTLSAAEYFILYAKNLYDKTVLVGDNSCGMLLYGGVFSYLLPDSKVTLYLSSSSNVHSVASLCRNNWKGEGNGIYPDIWATSEEIVDTMVYLTKDEELKNVILSGKLQEE